VADIAYIDDDPTEFMALAEQVEKDRIAGFEYDESAPGTEAFEAARGANVWLFDFFLVAPTPDESNEENGLSLFQKWRASTKGPPITVVVSSDLRKAIGDPLGPVQRRHVIAQQQGVEWIGEKTEETIRQVIELADAAKVVTDKLKPHPVEAHAFGTYEADQLCFDVLGAPRDLDWSNNVQRQIDRARPPREVLVTSGPAMARPIVGWLLTHVLPYPSFLLTDSQAALRLGIAPASFRGLAAAVGNDKKTKFRRMFVNCRYEGPLAAFLGRRWWRAGIDDFAWQVSESKEEYRAALQAMASGIPFDWLEQSEPVLVSDEDLVETDEVADAKDCVRVVDEDFPASVDPAWVSIAAARENRLLAAKVIFEDRGLLSEAE